MPLGASSVDGLEEIPDFRGYGAQDPDRAQRRASAGDNVVEEIAQDADAIHYCKEYKEYAVWYVVMMS